MGLPIIAGMVSLAGVVGYDLFWQAQPALGRLWSAVTDEHSIIIRQDAWRGVKTVKRLRRATLNVAATGRELLLSRSAAQASRHREALRRHRKEMARALQEYEALSPAAAGAPQWAQTRDLVQQYLRAIDAALTMGADRRASPAAVQRAIQNLDQLETATLQRFEELSDVHFWHIAQREKQLWASEVETPLEWVLVVCALMALTLASLPLLRFWRVQSRLQAQYRETVKTKELLQELSARLMQAQEEERRNISRELHDEIGQALTAARLDLALLERKLPSELTDLHEFVRDGKLLVEQTLQKVRDLNQILRPSLLEEQGLLPAIRWLTRRYSRNTGIEITLDAPEVEKRFAPEVEIALFRLVQECLTNIAKHSSATEARVVIAERDEAVEVTVQDNGSGIKHSSGETGYSRGLGLLGIRERVSRLGGDLDIVSAPGQGFQVLARVPLRVPSTEIALPAQGLSCSVPGAA